VWEHNENIRGGPLDVFFQPLRIGDRRRRAPAWLVVYKGAVRGMLSQGDDAEIVLAIGFDRRIQTSHPMQFRDLAEAHA
jgi:hypothetical protein